MKQQGTNTTKKPSGIFSLLRPYKGMVLLLILFTLISNGLNLWLPRIIGHSIDAFGTGTFSYKRTLLQFGIATLVIFIFTLLQSLLQTFASEKVARELRTRVADKISRQTYNWVETSNPSKLLTNLTSDVDAVKMFVSQAIAAIVSSIFIIIGAGILLFSVNWQLALAVLGTLPLMGFSFFYVLKRVRSLYMKSRDVMDWLNKVINESILGAALIRVLNSQQPEYEKFIQANTKAKDFGLSILYLFAGLIPVITFTANLGALIILALGGHFVIDGTMTLGDFAAFNSYLSLLIYPVLIIGFMSNVIAQASASFERIQQVTDAPDAPPAGTKASHIKGDIEFKDVSVNYGEKPVLKNVSFSIKAGSRVAVIGPTAAGKTQLLYLLTGLIKPNSGTITIDGLRVEDYDSESFHNQVGFVFQDSIMFNMSIRENIAFSDQATDASLENAINTAALKEFLDTLPDKTDTMVAERGTSLSGGQKQRIMLARALAVNPSLLLLDDFTARVDTGTEKRILQQLQLHYPGLTLLSVTQKIAAVEQYDQIIVLMQGEIIASGTHQELIQSSPEYVQIYNSQQSTSHYELQS